MAADQSVVCAAAYLAETARWTSALLGTEPIRWRHPGRNYGRKRQTRTFEVRQLMSTDYGVMTCRVGANTGATMNSSMYQGFVHPSNGAAGIRLQIS